MKVKVCGMREPENIRQIADLRPDYMGFIFYRSSKRYIGMPDHHILDAIPSSIKKAGIFVNSGFDEITTVVEKYKLNAVQLHGEESAELCGKLKHQGLEVIKAAGIDENFDFKTLEEYTGLVDHFLFDTKTSLYGGSGKLFDWKLLTDYPYKTSYFLSGGIGLDEIKNIQLIKDERLYAIDLNSRFESEPALKDVEKVKTAINKIRTKEK